MTNLDDMVNDALHEIHENPVKFKHVRGYIYHFKPEQLRNVAICEPRFGCHLQFDTSGILVRLVVEQVALDEWREDEGKEINDEG